MAPRSWWHIAAKLLQCLQFPAWEQHCPLPGDVYGSLPWNICQCPAWARLQSLPGTLASSLPGNACQCACPAWACLQSLPGTLASSLPGNACQFPAWERLPVPCLGHVLQSLPGTLCQFPAWERLPMPCLGIFASPCLGTPFAGTPSLAELFSYAYRTSMRGELLRLFKPEMPRTPVPCYCVSAMNVK